MNIFLIIAFMPFYMPFVIAALLIYIVAIQLRQKNRQAPVGVVEQTKKPLYVSLFKYFLAVAVFSIIFLAVSNNPQAGLEAMIWLWGASLIGLIPIAIINSRYYKIRGEQTKDTTTTTILLVLIGIGTIMLIATVYLMRGMSGMLS